MADFLEKNYVKYSILLGFILFTIFLVEYFLVVLENGLGLYSIVSLIVVTGFVVLLRFREGQLAYGQFIKHCLLMGVFAGIVLAILYSLYVNVIDTFYYENVARKMIELLEKEELNQYQIDSALKIFGTGRKYFVREGAYLAGCAVKTLALGLIVGAFSNSKAGNATAR